MAYRCSEPKAIHLCWGWRLGAGLYDIAAGACTWRLALGQYIFCLNIYFKQSLSTKTFLK
jgi:hypothetical protein